MRVTRLVPLVILATLALAACGVGSAPTPTPLPPIAAADLLDSTRASMAEVTSYAFNIDETHFGGTHEAGVSTLDGHWASPDRLQYDFVVTTDEGTWEGTEYRIGSSGQGYVHSGPVTGRAPLGFRATALINLASIPSAENAIVREEQLADGRRVYLVFVDTTREYPSDDGSSVATTHTVSELAIVPDTRRLAHKRVRYETTCTGAIEGLCGTNSDTTTTYSAYNVPVTIEFPEPEPTDRPPPPTATPTPPSANQ